VTQAKPKTETYQIEIRREIKGNEPEEKQETQSRYQTRFGRQQLRTSPKVSPQRKQNERRFGHQQELFESDFGGSSGGSGGSEVVSEKRKEKITIEGGVKKKTVIIEKVLKNGSVETEILTEDM